MVGSGAVTGSMRAEASRLPARVMARAQAIARRIALLLGVEPARYPVHSPKSTAPHRRVEIARARTLDCGERPSGEIGRRAGLKIRWGSNPVPVRPRPRAPPLPRKTHDRHRGA